MDCGGRRAFVCSALVYKAAVSGSREWATIAATALHSTPFKLQDCIQPLRELEFSVLCSAPRALTGEPNRGGGRRGCLGLSAAY